MHGTSLNIIRENTHNQWAIWVVLACLFAMVLLVIFTHQYGSFKKYLLQEYYESASHLTNWIALSIIFWLLQAVLVSPYLPMIPHDLVALHIGDYHLNKLGSVLLCSGLMQFSVSVLGAGLFLTTGNAERWPRYFYAISRFYFVYCLLLVVGIIALYYYPVDRYVFFVLLVTGFGIIFIFKQLYLIFHRLEILPAEWYYKILYICTLQFAPLLALWNYLFL